MKLVDRQIGEDRLPGDIFARTSWPRAPAIFLGHFQDIDHDRRSGGMNPARPDLPKLIETTEMPATMHEATDGDELEVVGIAHHVMHATTATSDSRCCVMPDRVFTGDTKPVEGPPRDR